MIYLLLCILSSSAVLVTFKYTERFKVNSFSAILVNYIVACLAGFFLAGGNLSQLAHLDFKIFLFIFFLGAMFISVFRLLGLSTQKAGVAVTSVAAKMSVILPVVFSVWIDKNDVLTSVKVIGIFLALVAVLLVTYRKDGFKSNSSGMYLPILIFLGIGIIDSATKYAQATFVTNDMNPAFNAIVFAVAGLIGFTLLPFDSKALQDFYRIKTWMLGAVLGLVNFGSMYFMIAALNHTNSVTGEHAQGSVIFGINNIGVVLVSVLLGFILFHERPTKMNWVGIAISVLAIFMLANG